MAGACTVGDDRLAPLRAGSAASALLSATAVDLSSSCSPNRWPRPISTPKPGIQRCAIAPIRRLRVSRLLAGVDPLPQTPVDLRPM